jgi:hypothetical protein
MHRLSLEARTTIDKDAAHREAFALRRAVGRRARDAGSGCAFRLKDQKLMTERYYCAEKKRTKNIKLSQRTHFLAEFVPMAPLQLR